MTSMRTFCRENGATLLWLALGAKIGAALVFTIIFAVPWARPPFFSALVFHSILVMICLVCYCEMLFKASEWWNAYRLVVMGAIMATLSFSAGTVAVIA